MKVLLGLLGFAALAGLALFLKSEVPAMRRYLKIERM
jgi:hypothetical protein